MILAVRLGVPFLATTEGPPFFGGIYPLFFAIYFLRPVFLFFVSNASSLARALSMTCWP